MDTITIALLGIGAYILFSSHRKTYGFTYRQKYGGWRAYFNGNPPTMIHVLQDNDGYYVCWDRPLRNEREARQVAQRWTEIYGQTTRR